MFLAQFSTYCRSFDELRPGSDNGHEFHRNHALQEPELPFGQSPGAPQWSRSGTPGTGGSWLGQRSIDYIESHGRRNRIVSKTTNTLRPTSTRLSCAD